MTNKEVHKIVKNDFNTFFKQYGFIRQSNSEWILIKAELIQIIYLQFSYGQERFDFDIAILPLCIPSDFINYNISNRLSYFDSRSEYRGWGSYDEANLAADIKDAKETIERDVFPWLNSMENCLDLIEFLDNSLISGTEFHIPPFRRTEYLTIICYYKHELKRGKKYADLYYTLSKNSPGKSPTKSMENIKTIEQLASKDISELDNYFTLIIQNNKTAWQLKIK